MISGGLIVSWPTIRHSVRSASTCIDWRQALPVPREARRQRRDVRVEEVVGEPPVERARGGGR